MDIDSSRIQALIERPTESLSVEIKRWLDPDSKEGIAKIVKTVLALRNHGGGYLVIGFDNNTLTPDQENIPEKVKEKYHIDKIQGLISRFASEHFEIFLEFPERNKQEYPVLIVPPGVKTPVAAKSDLYCNDKDRYLIKNNMVYIRSLKSNNTPSSTQATWKDWPNIVEICFANREADIGRFLRRQLGGLKAENIKEFVKTILNETEPQPSVEDQLARYLQACEKRYESVILERNLVLPEHGSWEVSLIILGKVPAHSANGEFLNLLDSNNPGYTGWPVWLDSRGFSDKKSMPYVNKNVWECMITSLEGAWSNDIDFMILDPTGKFYLRRALEDDISRSPRAPEPLKALDFGLPIIRSAEAIAVGISFARAMGCDPEKTHLSFAFKWSRLRGRVLISWAEQGRYFPQERSAYQDKVISFVTVPLETPLLALSPYVENVVKPLFEIFDGLVINQKVIEELTQRLIQRKL